MDQHPVRLASAALLAVAAAIPGVLGDGIPGGIHSPNVVDAEHSPKAPDRRQDVGVLLDVEPEAALKDVILTYCRAEIYACAPSQEMTEAGPDRFQGRIVWDGRFFAEARNVGYKFTLRFANGSVEHSPLQHWPSRPAVLPEGAGIYYWYPLPPPPGAAAPGVLATGLLLVMGAWLWTSAGRRRDGKPDG